MTGVVLSQRVTFSAVHRLEGEGARDHYRMLHGHSFEVDAGVRGSADDHVGWVVDLASLREDLEAAVAPLSGAVLNDVPGLPRATLEHLCAFVAGRLKASHPGLAFVEVARPSLGQRCRIAF
jgi:6-pyruvoyltetrahydropterin/6-carboxytetrahydropterin synthase